MPWSPTAAFPHPFCKVNYDIGPTDRFNRASYDIVEMMVSVLIERRFFLISCLFRPGLVCVILSIIFVKKLWNFHLYILEKQFES
jgi:hypothetical protein